MRQLIIARLMKLSQCHEHPVYERDGKKMTYRELLDYIPDEELLEELVACVEDDFAAQSEPEEEEGSYLDGLYSGHELGDDDVFDDESIEPDSWSWDPDNDE